MNPMIRNALPLLMLCLAYTSYGQGPVVWNFRTTPLAGNETTLLINATLAPGWHLYSQRMKEGGPIPTRFRFDAVDDYIPVGTTEESGAATVFYDHTHQMEITWYTGTANFSQRFRLSKPDVTIKGKVEYMTCDDRICIPGEREFSIDVSQ